MRTYHGGEPDFEHLWELRNAALGLVKADLRSQFGPSYEPLGSSVRDKLSIDGLSAVLGLVALKFTPDSQLTNTAVPTMLHVPGIWSQTRGKISETDRFSMMPSGDSSSRMTTIIKDIHLTRRYPVGVSLDPFSETEYFYVPQGSWSPEGPRRATEDEQLTLYRDLQFAIMSLEGAVKS